jgi:hypothetical protein
MNYQRFLNHNLELLFFQCWYLKNFSFNFTYFLLKCPKFSVEKNKYHKGLVTHVWPWIW